MNNKIDKKREMPVHFGVNKVSPKYNITLEKVDGKNDWTISGEINGITTETAKTIDLVADETISIKETVEKISENTEVEEKKHKKNIGATVIKALTIIGLLAGTACLIHSCTKSINDNSKIIEETTEPSSEEEIEITMYAVNYDMNLFTFPYLLSELKNIKESNNIIKLRGIEGLNDNDFEKYSEDLKRIEEYINLIESGKEVDFYDFLKYVKEINNYAIIAHDEIQSVIDSGKEPDNEKILRDNLLDTYFVQVYSDALIESIEDAINLKKEYPNSAIYTYPLETVSDSLVVYTQDTILYGYHDEGIQLFSTKEEAQEFYDKTTADYWDIMCEHDNVNGNEKNYHSLYNVEFYQYTTTKTQEELEDAIINDKFKNGIEKTKILENHDGTFYR